MTKKTQHIFIFKVGSLGDTVVAFPAVKKIADHYNTKLHFITNKPASGIFPAWEIFKHSSYFEDAFEFDFSQKGILGLMKYVNTFKGEKILYYLVGESPLKRNLRNYLFFKLIGFNKIYGWKECTGKHIIKNPDGTLKELPPEYIRLQKIVEKYTGQKPEVSPEYNFLFFDNHIIESANNKLAINGSKYMVLGIGGKNKIQRWDISKYAEVLNKYEQDIKVVILGGKAEEESADFLVSKIQNKEVINLCGKTSILESAYILKNAILYLGNDTGTAHLAGLAGCKCVVVTSARDNPGRWMPIGNNHIIIRKNPECAGCWLHTDDCPNNIKCLNEITSEEVLEELKSVNLYQQ